MITIEKSYPIPEFPFNDLEVVSHLLYYDGPILTHFKHDKFNYLSLWVDQDNTAYRWLIFKVSEKNLIKYLTQKLSLRELLLINDFVILTDIEGEDYKNNYSIQSKYLIDDYIPEEGTCIIEEIPKIYNPLLEMYSEKRKEKDFVELYQKIMEIENNRHLSFIKKHNCKNEKDLLELYQESMGQNASKIKAFLLEFLRKKERVNV